MSDGKSFEFQLLAIGIIMHGKVMIIKKLGISFERKTYCIKSFEFNFQITVASRIASTNEIIMKNNEK